MHAIPHVLHVYTFTYQERASSCRCCQCCCSPPHLALPPGPAAAAAPPPAPPPPPLLPSAADDAAVRPSLGGWKQDGTRRCSYCLPSPPLLFAQALSPLATAFSAATKKRAGGRSPLHLPCPACVSGKEGEGGELMSCVKCWGVEVIWRVHLPSPLISTPISYTHTHTHTHTHNHRCTQDKEERRRTPRFPPSPPQATTGHRAQSHHSGSRPSPSIAWI